MRRLLVPALLLAPLPAFAHGGADHAHAFATGFLHPLGGMDHLVAMVTLGACAGIAGGRMRLAAPACFLAAMLAGCLAAIAGLSMPLLEAGILASVIVLGALLAASFVLPPALALAAATAFGFLHGSAHGAEMAEAPLTALAGMLAATALLHGAGVLLAASPGSKTRLALRLAGGASAAAAIGSILLPV